MADNEIKVPIEIDVAQLQKSLEKIEKSIDKFADKTEKGLSKTNLAFSNFIGNLSANIATKTVGTIQNAFSDFFGGVISESAEAEISLNKLGTSLLSTGEKTAENIKLFSDLATEIQRTTKFSDEMVLNNIAVAKAAGLNNAATEALIKSATDYAAVTGKDLESATEALVKSLGGEARALKVLGPEFAGLTEAQLKSGAAIDLIAKKFDSAAENETKTFSGAIQSLKNSYSDLQEEVGNALVKNQDFSNVIQSVKAFIDRLKDSLANSTVIADALNASIQFLVSSFSSLLRGADLITRFLYGVAQVSGVVSNSLGVLIGYVIKISATIINAASDFLGFGSILDGFLSKTNKVLSFFKGQVSANVAQLTAKPEKTIFGKAADEVYLLSTNLKNGVVNSTKNMDKLTDSTKKFSDVYKAATTAKDTTKEQKKQNEILNQQLELYKKINAEIEVGAKNPFVSLFNKTETQRGLEKELKRKDLSKEERSNIQNALDQSQKNSKFGAAAGIFQDILGGAQGASKLLSSGISSLAESFLPGLGAVAGPIAEVLFAGPEAVKGLVKSFAEAVPTLIQNLIEAIPAVVEAIAEQTPIIIDRLVQSIPRIIDSLAQSMPQVAVSLAAQMPTVANQFAIAMIENAPKIAEAIAKSIPQAAGGGIKSVGKLFKFADGGIVGGNSFQGDNVLARVNSGEMILNREQQATLFNKVNKQDNTGVIVDAINALSVQINSRPIIVQVDGREIARVVKNQRKAGFEV